MNVALLFAAKVADTLPTEIRLFGAGVTRTKKGDFLFDEQAADAVLSAFSDSGVDRLPFDVGHQMFKPEAGPDGQKAAGWFVPEVREVAGGVELWAAEIEWTQAGGDALLAREYRFFSPAITYAGDERRVTSLLNIALTNIPATKDQPPIVLEDDGQNGDEMKVLLDKLGAVDETGAIEKLETLEAARADLAGKLDDAIKLAADAQSELAEIRETTAKAERAAAIAELSQAGKLPPSAHEFAASLSAEQFDAYAATLSARVESDTVEPAPKGAALSDIEIQICTQLGMSPEAFIKAKKGA